MINYLAIFVVNYILLFVTLRGRFNRTSTNKKQYPIFIKKLLIMDLIASYSLSFGLFLIGDLTILPLLLLFIAYVMIRANVLLPLLLQNNFEGITLKGMQRATSIVDLIMLVLVSITFLKY